MTRQWNNVRLNLQRFKVNPQGHKVFESQAGYDALTGDPVGISIPSTIEVSNAWDTAVQGTPPAGQQIGWTAGEVLPTAGDETSRSQTEYDTAGR